uniref:uncharacterized protein LOC120337354 n=1 Tax=Styela clava TaxID=7725 RepID=UPI001939FFBB|nr:uncharacterized protein LOC120337354 [Styela clava]
MKIIRGRKRGIYHFKQNSLAEMWNSFVGPEKKKSTIRQESVDFSSYDTLFLTDYDNFFIVIFKSHAGWNGYVKARTPQITSNQLRLISEVLNENGLESSVMTLKNVCLRMDNDFIDPAAVILV